MRADILDLREFYDSNLGQIARRMIRRRLRDMWPNVSGLTMLGMGYATPFLRIFKAEAERVLAVMPPEQGVTHWPLGEANLVFLGHENALPIPDRSVDRLLVVHTLEATENSRALLRECWRILADGGRMVVVVPSRRGIWARLERTPFGNGRPFSPNQLKVLLRDNMFAPMRTERALFLPPTGWRMVLPWAWALERLGNRWFPTIAGVLMIEAGKQIYAPLEDSVAAKRRYAVIPQNLQPNSNNLEADGLRREDMPKA